MTAEEKAVRAAGVENETNVVTSTNMSEYFLLDHDIVRRAVEKGGIITKTGRGSAPSYYTNSLLGLSSIQPLPKEGDIDPHHVDLRLRIPAPDPFHDLIDAVYDAGMLHKQFHQLKSLVVQLYFPPLSAQGHA